MSRVEENAATDRVVAASCPAEGADYGIKVRKTGSKSWAFLTPIGGTIRLKIHAARYTSNNASAAIVNLTLDNPGYDFKKVVL